MTLHVHTLAGCAPTPLAHYLKALGVLRLVAEQKDETIRGWWRDETFHIATRLSCEELEGFFLDEYRPTPLLAPWNGGSGFYPNDNKSGIQPIEASVAPRLAPYREAIVQTRRVTRDLEKSPKDEAKNELLQECRRTWRGPVANWLEAALVLTEDGSPVYPALLGTGGNDGRLDFTNNFMQRLTELFDCAGAEVAATPGAQRLLSAALFAATTTGLGANAVGQFFPGAAGGANNNVGFGGGAMVNPWDFVLMLEGSLAFAAAVTRRVTTESLPQAAAPFAVYASAAGYASAADGEKSRGEQWMPLWDRPATHREIAALLAEGRCQTHDTDSRPRTAQRPLDVARAVARLGVARGVRVFQRFGYIERNGQANLAAPLGRWHVPERPLPHLELVDEIKPWFDRLRRAAGDKNAPEGVVRQARLCENAILACCRDEAGPARWQQLLTTLGEAETQLVRTPRFTAEKGLQPLGAFSGGLSVAWLHAVNDRSPELRLALALASQHGLRLRTQEGRTTIHVDLSNPVRRHFLPLEDCSKQGWTPRRFDVASEKLREVPAVVCESGDLERDAIRLVRRRIIEGRQAGSSLFPLLPIRGAEASLADILQFINGELDAVRIRALARPLMALDWSEFSKLAVDMRAELGCPSPDDERKAADALALYGLLRLCHHGGAVPVPMPSRDRGRRPQEAENEWAASEVLVRLDPAIFPRLASGHVQLAVQLAVRRLSVSGLRPKLRKAVGAAVIGRRLAAALAFPVGWLGARLLAARLTRPSFKPGDMDPTEQPVQESLS